MAQSSIQTNLPGSQEVPARIYRSPFADLELSRSDLLTFLFSNPYNTPLNKPIFVCPETKESRTYGDIIKRTRSLSYALRQFGLQKNDVVAFVSSNTIDYAIICYAVIGSGAIVSPMSASLTHQELNAQFETSQAKMVVAHSSVINNVRKAVKGTIVQRIIQANGKSTDGTLTAEELSATSPEAELVRVPESQTEDQIAFMCFSSGTSGKAKGVITTHRNITSNIQQWSTHFGKDDPVGGNSIAFLPFSHIYAFNNYLCMKVMRGNTIVVMPKFELSKYLGAIEKYRPTDLQMVPPVALSIAKDPKIKDFDLSSVERVLCAAAPLSLELARAVENKFQQIYGKEIACFQAWGLTETSPLLSAAFSDGSHRRPGVGYIAPNMVCRFVDPDTMEDVKAEADGTSQQGEVWCRGPNVTPGYFRNDEATTEAFTIDRGLKWFRTGDIGTIDKNGWIELKDRNKEMIKYKGNQVIPSELEGKLQEHPDVDDCCVVGQWVESWGTELPTGFIVLSPQAKQKDQKQTVAAINVWLNERISKNKRLRGGIFVVDAIAKNPSGKILRRKMKELLAKPQPRATKL